MAKQKRKKPVHKNKPVLPRKDRTVYEIILLFVFSVSLILLRSHEYVFYYCASLFGTRDGYYYDLHLTPVSVLLFLCLVAFALISVFFFGELCNKAITLRQLTDKNSREAKRFVKSITAAFAAVLLVFCISFCVADSSKTVATNQSVTATYFIKDDEIIVDYNDVTEVKLYVERELIARGKGMTSSRYTPAIKLYTDNGYTVLSASGFGFNYDKMNEYLKLFDPEIITVDDTDYDMMMKNKIRYREVLNQMFHD